jgi:hypothetical protein
MRRASWWLLLPLGSLASAGCGPPPRFWRFRAPVFHAASAEASPRRSPRPRTPEGAAAFVERALHQRGLRFGTDGTVAALHSFLRAKYRTVPPAQARPGDVVFFALDERSAGCDSHAGLVEAVDATGRITFRERRDGEVRRSFAAPADPRTRRDSQGRILNTFLRPRRPEDAPGLRYFSGEMLCAVMRVEKN